MNRSPQQNSTEGAPSSAPSVLEAEHSRPLADLGTGLAFLAIGIVMWLAVADLRPAIPGTVIGAGLLPRICAALISCLGAVLAVQGALRSRRHKSPHKISFDVSAILVPALLITVWLTAPITGFLTATGAAGLIMMRVQGGRSSIGLFCVVVLMAVIWLLFAQVMRIQMPHGWLI